MAEPTNTGRELPEPPVANKAATPNATPRLRAALPDEDSLKVNVRESFRSLLDLDVESLNPNYTYRWVRKDKVGVSRAKLRKYTPVDPDSKEGKAIRNALGDAPGISTDGLIQEGDLVLMRTPKQNFRARRKALHKEGERRLGVAKRRFKKLAKRANVDTIINKE